jgi:hypothetical protein
VIDTATIAQAHADDAPETDLCAACRQAPAEVDDLCGPCWANAYEADRYAAAIYAGAEIAGFDF